MDNLPLKKQSYIGRLFSSLRELLHEQEPLGLKGIRPDHLPYFFAFPLAMILINIQDHIWVSSLRIYGFPSTTILFIVFTISATGMLIFATQKNIAVISRISAALTAAGLIPWLLLPDGLAAFVCVGIFMAGIGGCLSGSSFFFVFILNNTERFWGTALMLLTIGLIELGAPLFLTHVIARKLLSLLLAAGLCTCMFLSKSEHSARSCKSIARRFHPSIWLALFIFFSYFTIRIMNFYIPAFQQQPATEVWGVLTLLPVLICVLLQATFRYSVWTMCNLFFLSSIASYALWYARLPEAAYLLAGMDKVGLFVSFYLIGSVTNKFCSFRMHKLLLFLCMTLIGILYVTSDLLIQTSFAHIVAVTVSVILFVLFLLLSPIFSRHLFFSDWSEEFRKLQMTDHAMGEKRDGQTEKEWQPSLDDTKLSLREKQVVLLLLRGLTLRQIASELGLTFSTVSTYSKTIYRKLSINSRAELFLLFRHQPIDTAAEHELKK